MTKALLFLDLVTFFNHIEQASSRLTITELLADCLKKASPEEARLIAYLSLGSLLPEYKGGQFHFAEKSMLTVLSSHLNRTPEQIKHELAQYGDLGAVVANTRSLQSSFINHFKQYSVLEIALELHQFMNESGAGSASRKEQQLLSLLASLAPEEKKYVIRIILGTLRLGFSDMTLLDAFSWMMTGDKSLRKMLEECYTICADIGLIVYTLKKEGVDGLKKFSITPGIPLRPAAAERLSSAQAIVEKLGPCVAQPKLDGFRVQVHLEKNDHGVSVHFFSRNLHESSFMFPDLIAEIKDFPVGSLIVEGEALCYREEDDRFLPFQETAKRKRKHNVEQAARDYPLRLYLFDVLYYNGQSLLERSHTERRALLEKICKEREINNIKQHVFCIEEKAITTAQELESFFYQSIEDGLEGLVIKRPDAPYTPGKRNFNWIKLKRQETGSLDDTIDCVILGYYSGKGKRAHFGIGALLVGIYNDAADQFLTIAKIGTGLTDHEWKSLREELNHLVLYSQPHSVECKKELIPDYWVTPKIVCSIRADEITLSPLHSAQYALRFPRIMAQRSDKSATDSTTLTEIKKLFLMQKNIAKK